MIVLMVFVLIEIIYLIVIKFSRLRKNNNSIAEKKYKLDKLDNLIENKELELDQEPVETKDNDIDYSNQNQPPETNNTINNIDYEALIKDFISRITPNDKYDFCVNLRAKFTSNVIYELKTKLESELEDYLKQLLTINEYRIYEFYKSIVVDNSIDNFVDYLDQLIDLNNPHITILVGSAEENYNYLDKNIETKVVKDIYKGIKIIYKNKIYDFSLNERDV